MTLLVTNNANGTFTVSCGNEAVTVGNPAIVTNPNPGGSNKWPTVSGGGGGVTANLFANNVGTFTVEHHDARTVGDITSRLKASLPTDPAPISSTGQPQTQRFLRFRWNSNEPLDMKEISEVWSSFGDQSYLHCEICLLGTDG